MCGVLWMEGGPFRMCVLRQMDGRVFSGRVAVCSCPGSVSAYGAQCAWEMGESERQSALVSASVQRPEGG